MSDTSRRSQSRHKGRHRGVNRTSKPVANLPDTVQVEVVTSLAHGGYGVARLDDGPVVFIEGAVPGDREVKVALDHGRSRTRLWWGRARSIGAPSPWRKGVLPACPAAQRGAGCCDFPGLQRHASAYAKALIVADQLARIAHIRNVDVPTKVMDIDEDILDSTIDHGVSWHRAAIVRRVESLEEVVRGEDPGTDTDHAEVPSSVGTQPLTIQPVTVAPETGWRTRVRLAVDSEGTVGYRAYRSHEVISINAAQPCTQIDPRILQKIGGFAEKVAATTSGVAGATTNATSLAAGTDISTVGVDASTTGTVRSTDGPDASKTLAAEKRSAEGELLLGVDSHGEVTAAYAPKIGESVVLSEKSTGTYIAEGQPFTIAPEGFWQAHRAAPILYRQIVRHLLRDVRGITGWDLYGGSGLFADVIAEKVRQVDSVDIAAPVDDTSEPAGDGKNGTADSEMTGNESAAEDNNKMADREATHIEAANGGLKRKLAPSATNNPPDRTIRFIRAAVGEDWTALRLNPEDGSDPFLPVSPEDDLPVIPPPRSERIAQMIRLSERTGRPGLVDIVLLDPPRAGAGGEVIEQVAHRHPKVVIHVACDPAAGARDLASWVANGYTIDEMIVVDAFPGTHHTETITRLLGPDYVLGAGT